MYDFETKKEHLKFKMMNLPKYFLTAIICAVALNLPAQNAANDSIAPKRLPVQAFAAMPVLLGISAENAFPHDKKYRTFANSELTLPMTNSQAYGIYGSLPIIKKTKGFSAKANFAYNVFKDNIGTTTFNDQVLIEDIEGTGTSANTSLNISQQILFKKWQKKLTLSAAYSVSGKGFGSFKKQSQKGVFSATLPLKMSPDAMFLIGAVGFVGKNVKRPILPIVAYFTRLGSRLNVELILPVSGQLRYVISPKSSVLLGARIGTRTPFMDTEIPVLQSTDDALEFKSQNLRYYLNAEKAVNKFLWLQAEIGYNRNIKEALITSNVDLRNRVFIGEGFGYMYARIGAFVRPVFGTIKSKPKAK
jgi:hypothetical protein